MEATSPQGSFEMESSRTTRVDSPAKPNEIASEVCPFQVILGEIFFLKSSRIIAAMHS